MRTDFVIVEQSDFAEFQMIAKTMGLEFMYKESDGEILILDSLDKAEEILFQMEYEQWHKKNVKTTGGFVGMVTGGR